MSTGILLGQGGGSSIPAGLICMWSGSSSNIPNGWALCNGNNNTPDLRDKFVLGAGKDYIVGATGGEKEVTLTVAQMPSHSHDYVFNNNKCLTIGGAGDSTGGVEWDSRYSYDKLNILKTGGGESHNNMPPYYALCFIMKL